MGERAEPIVGVRTVAIAIHRARPGAETAIPFPEDEDYAIAAIKALRSMSVDQRMQAMGMVPFRYGNEDGGGEYAIVWGEPDA